MAGAEDTHSGHDHLFKLLLVGDAGVGKSSILVRFTDGTFDEQQQPTIGVDFKVAHMDVAGRRIKVTIWDTAGQERFRTLTSAYYRGSHGILLVYDVTRQETFQHLPTWLEEVDSYCAGGGKGVVKLLVGNKTDLAERRVVERADGEEFARRNGMLFMETSAKSSAGIKQVFEELVEKVLETPSLLSATTTPGSREGAAAAPARTVKLSGGGNGAGGGGDGCCW